MNPPPDFGIETQKNVRLAQQALQEHPSVDSSVVLAGPTEQTREELVAYIVPAGSFAPERLRAHLQSVLPTAAVPSAFIPLASLPLTSTGQADELALRKLPAIDADLMKRWENVLQSQPGVDQVAVVAQEQSEGPCPLHLSDLLPDWKTATEENAALAVTSPDSLGGQEQTISRPAISLGHPILWGAGAPTTLQEALHRARSQAPEKDIVYFQADGSVICQSYAALVADAERILAGLRKLGLAPGDKILFQLDRNQDFISAFWACVLGGIIPVPISIPPTYEQINANVSKLHNAWQLLSQPWVLTRASLLSAIQSLSKHLPFQGLRVAAIEELRASPPDSSWHVSQPDEVVLMLLTSGSSGKPKAVMQCHRSILSRSAATAQMNHFSGGDVSLNWFPLDHVGGIVMFHIRDLYLCARQVHVPTQLILRDSLKWLDLVDQYRATITWAPNFAYGLINAQAEEIGRRHWDLSSLRFILNAGEAIVAKTARRFLELLAPHGLPATAMHPAWGMSETSSAVTYSDQFLLTTTTDQDSFVEVGTPIPGISVRIVDAKNRVIEEEKIGCLQIRGATVTSGYYQNPELNREVFTDDDWFNTGDLGFLRQGHLTITGRQKDVIIINGVNFYSHEIETVVEEVSGVEVSFTAACAVRDPGSNTDSLAIFFHPRAAGEGKRATLLKEIRGRVVRSLGIDPSYLIPVPKEAIPKTEIGKIQRAQLRKRFEEGEFAALLKQLDIESGNRNTLSAWFYRKIWRPKNPLPTQVRPGSYLVFLDPLGLGELLCQQLRQAGHAIVGVEAAADFGRLASDRFCIQPGNSQHYRRLVQILGAEGVRISQALHLWTYDRHKGDIPSLEALEKAQDLGANSLLFLSQALGGALSQEQRVRLLVISSHSQPVSLEDQLACERTPLLGLIKSILQEMPGLEASHLDLPVGPKAENASLILSELGARGDPEVAYRGGRRLIPRLERVDLTRQHKHALPFKAGGLYLLSGGLGGIGVELAKYLLQHYHCRLLLVGRTPLPEPNTWEAYLKQSGPQAERVKSFLSLQQIGEVRYEAADICDFPRLRQIVDRAEAEWHCALEGVVHLAGVYQDRLLADETLDTFAAALRPKLAGTWVLQELVKDRPGTLFLSFSSVLGFLGGAMVGAYAAANRFVEAFSHHLRSSRSVRSSCYCWSIWNDVGMSRGHQSKGALNAKGIQSLSVEQGLRSLIAGLHRDQAELFIGLDESTFFIRRHLESTSVAAQQLCAYYTSSSQAAKTPCHPERSEGSRQSAEEILRCAQNDKTVTSEGVCPPPYLPPTLGGDTEGDQALKDRFQISTTCECVRIEEMPRTTAGEIDRARLIDSGRRTRRGGVQYVAPRTEGQRRVAVIWQEVLGVPQIGIDDNFFELGGHSLLATKVISRLRDAFGVDLSLRSLFEGPTVAGLARHLERVFLDEERSAAPALRPVPRHQDLPLSFAQQRLWFFAQLEPESPVYNISSAVQIRGPLHVPALEQSLSDILRRHEALRTKLPAVEGRPVQVVSPPQPLRLPVIDLGGLPKGKREAEAQRLAEEDARRPFDLAGDLMLRPSLLRLGLDEHVLVLTMHHIASDGWSNNVLFRELAACYEAFRSGKPSPLGELAIQYGDYAVWQREWLQGEVLEKQINYWKCQLAGAPSRLELPTDHPRPAVQNFRGAIFRLAFPGRLAAGVKELSRQEETTLFMTLLAAFQTLLYASSGQTDICVGSPIAGRVRTETEGLIGFFANTLVFRTRLTGNPSFREVLGRVREVALGAYAHQDLPFEKLVEALRPPRDPSHNPLFQVNFRVQTAPPPFLQLPGLECRPMEIDPGIARFDLALELWALPEGFQGYIEYNTDLFEAATIAQLSRNFENLLEALLAQPNIPLSQLGAFIEAAGGKKVSDPKTPSKGIRRLQRNPAGQHNDHKLARGNRQ